MKYKVILFDADETLFDFKKSEEVALKGAMTELGFDYDEEHHLKEYIKINTAIWREFEEGKISQKKLKVERFKRFLDHLKLHFDEFEFSKVYMNHLANASILYPDATKLIEELHPNYKLIIITNGLTDVQETRIGKSTIAHYFSHIVISESVGVSKPSPEIFELALQKIDSIDKTQVLMVGDSLSSDIQGGINFGIDTCWYNPNAIENTTKIKPTYEIRRLDQLPSMIL